MLQHFAKFWQSYEKKVWSKRCPWSNTIVTEPLSILTRGCNSGCCRVHAEEPEIERGNNVYTSFCRKVLNPVGYAVFLTELFRSDIFTSTLRRTGLIFMPYLYAILHDFGTMPKRHIPVILKNKDQYAGLTRTPGCHPNNLSHILILGSPMLPVFHEGLTP